MEHPLSLAPAAGLSRHAPKYHEHLGCGDLLKQPWFAPVRRRDLMTAVISCRRLLGLSAGAISSLDALLSCLPCERGGDGVITPQTLLTIFASNETLCLRAKGITDRQLRRHLVALEEAGLLLRRDSANGKRFPLTRGGKIVGAFGLDLSPLLARSAELLAWSKSHIDEQQEIRGLRAQIRARCTEMARAAELDEGLLNSIVSMARRVRLTLIEARSLLARVMGEASRPQAEPQPAAPSHDPCSTIEPKRHNKTSGSAGHFDRLKEPESDPLIKRSQSCEPILKDWEELTAVNSFYPEPVSSREELGIIYQFGAMLGLSQDILTKATQLLASNLLLTLLDSMAIKLEDITNPTGYFSHLVTKYAQPRHLET